LYGSDWFAASDDFKKSMRVIMSFCNQPLVLRASSFVPINQETFLSVRAALTLLAQLISQFIHLNNMEYALVWWRSIQK
jgi:hypothetical protein